MTLKKKVESDFINRGADVSLDKKAVKVEMVDICLRMSKSMLKRIDEAKIEGSSRNAWIRQAINDKL